MFISFTREPLFFFFFFFFQAEDGIRDVAVTGVQTCALPIFGSFSLVAGRRSLAGSLIGGIKETQEMLDFCSKNNIASEIELIPIQKVNEAYKRVLNSDVRYRFVIDIKSLEQK